jgi:hypothetical protein
MVDFVSLQATWKLYNFAIDCCFATKIPGSQRSEGCKESSESSPSMLTIWEDRSRRTTI